MNIGALTASLGVDTSGLSRAQTSLTSFGNRGNATMSSLSRSTALLQTAIGGLAGIYGLMKLSRAMINTVNAAGKFEKSMATVSTLLDTTRVNMGALGDEILSMTVEVTKSSTDLAEGLYQVISAGVDAADAVDVLRVAAQAATAGLTSTFTSVDAITTVLNAYGLQSQEATRVSDLMFQTVKLGKTTFEELASSIGTVIAPASALDIKLEDLFAAMATLTKGGLDTRTATTALRATFLSILKPSDDALRLARKLNLEWSATALTTKGLVKFINELKEATQGNTEQMATMIPEARALNAVLALTGKQSEEFNRITGEMSDVLGSTQEAFRKQEDTYEAQKEKLSLMVDAIQIKIGKVFVPALTTMLTSIRNFFEGVGDVLAPIGRMEEQLKRLEQGRTLKGLLGKRVNISIEELQRLREKITEVRKELDIPVTGFLSTEEFKRVEARLKEMGETGIRALSQISEKMKDLGKVSKDTAKDLVSPWDAYIGKLAEAEETLGVKTKAGFIEAAENAVSAFRQIAQTELVKEGDFDKLQTAFQNTMDAISKEFQDADIALGFGINEDQKTLIISEFDSAGNEILRTVDNTKQQLETIEIGGTLAITDGQRENISGTWEDVSGDLIVTIENTTTTMAQKIDKAIEDITGMQAESFDAIGMSITDYSNRYIATEQLITTTIITEIDKRKNAIISYVTVADTQLDSLEAHILRINQLRAEAVFGGFTPVLGNLHTGTSYVPATGPYMLKEGEAVIPASQNISNLGGSSNTFGDVNINMASEGIASPAPGIDETADMLDELAFRMRYS